MSQAADRLSLVEADRELLARLLEELRVDREPAGSALAEYAQLLLDRFVDWLPLGSLRPLEALSAERLGALALACVALALLALVVHLLRSRSPRSSANASQAPRIESSPPLAVRDVDWRAQLEARLAAGDVRGALEALWRWLGGALGVAGGAESWTLRELLGRCGREDLRSPVLQLERLSYGPVPPRADQVRALRARLEERLG